MNNIYQDYISRNDEITNLDLLRGKMGAIFYNRETFLDKQLQRAINIMRKNVTRPQYSAQTQERIKELINELNRLDSAIKRDSK